ncbi:MAG: AraC family transcriptional regulator [Clostridiaceae bacterium]|nr:AraC family transcriptional regulator [Clostridiaceae bacterium]
MADDRNDNPATRHYTADMFVKSIPFKIYRLEDGLVQTGLHSHEYLQIWYILSGHCIHQIGSQDHELVGGDIFVVPPFIPHRVMTENGKTVEIIGCEFLMNLINENFNELLTQSSLFDFAYIKPFLASNQTIQPCVHLSGANRELVESLLLEMLEDYQEEPDYYQLNIKADVLKLLTVIARLYQPDQETGSAGFFQKYRESMSAVLDYINKNYTKELYLNDICLIALMSKANFSYVFKHVTGKTLVAYINYLRIKKAEELLRDNRLTTTEICFQVGFNDTTYFARVFRKETGVSPKEFRSGERPQS